MVSYNLSHYFTPIITFNSARYYGCMGPTISTWAMFSIYCPLSQQARRVSASTLGGWAGVRRFRCTHLRLDSCRPMAPPCPSSRPRRSLSRLGEHMCRHVPQTQPETQAANTISGDSGRTPYLEIWILQKVRNICKTQISRYGVRQIWCWL